MSDNGPCNCEQALALQIEVAELRVYREAFHLVASGDIAEKVLTLLKERNELRRQSNEYCGICVEPIGSDIVNIRSLGAPNPFCSMDCAQKWSSTGTGSG